MCVCVCVRVRACVRVCVCSIAKWLWVPGSIPSWCCCFLEQETLLILLQSTQLLKWGPGGLVPTGGSSPLSCNINGYLGKQMLNFKCLIEHLNVQVGLRGTTPSPVRHGTASCGLLVLPQEGIPALTHSAQVPQLLALGSVTA